MADALLVIDVQHDLVAALPAPRRSAFVGTVASLIDRARSSGAPVVFVQHADEELVHGSPGWEIADGVRPRADEPVVGKSRRDGFDDTNLHAVLAERGIDRVVICGMQSDFCVAATARGAAAHRYATTIAGDAHATYPAGSSSEAEICEAINAALLAEGITVTDARVLFAAE